MVLGRVNNHMNKDKLSRLYIKELVAPTVFGIQEGSYFSYQFVHPTQGGQTQYGRLLVIPNVEGSQPGTAYVRHANGNVYVLRDGNNLIKNVKPLSEEDYKALGLPDINPTVPEDLKKLKDHSIHY